MFLILGASGFIGNKLFNYFKDKVDIKGTYRSHSFNAPEKDKIFLDLTKPDFSKIKSLKNLTHIIYCAGVSNIDECKINKDLSYKINVINTLKLFEDFINSNVIPVYLSTDMVYSGTKKFYKETDKPSPITEYGKQKLEVEKYIIKHFKCYIILRLTKVYGVEKKDKTLFTLWLDSFLEGKTISTTPDNFISPLYVGNVIFALERLILGKNKGVFNLGGPEMMNRYELSLRLANFFGFNSNLIKKISIKDFCFVEPRPKYSSLNSKKILKTTGLKLTTINKGLKLIQENYKYIYQKSKYTM